MQEQYKNLSAEQIETLAQTALHARNNAYAPYSRYLVGAALLCGDGAVFTGCNVENASYGATNCAERTAFFKAVSEGKREFKAIAIAGGTEGQDPADYAYPCGVCRQVMQEFGGDDFLVCVVKGIKEYKLYTLKELLPYGFGGASIQ